MSRVRPLAGPTISLFPFLAVLLCTMGALLVLLVIFSSSASRGDAQAAAKAAAAKAAETAKAMQEELELARDEIAWRIEQMKGMRARTTEDLSRARMQLAGIEADSRTLVDELDELERTAAALAAEPEESEAPLADLEQRLADARDRLEKTRRGAAERPAAYAVVPYDGDSGTRRRPFYIECCLDGVFLQPEGIRLGPADFEGPPGPGNPLASALRAAREYLASRPGESGEPSAQPYPLLLVRPSGVMAYYAARESLQSWGSEFGYQFVDEDWTLTYPPADPEMAAAETRAIEEARRRLEWLAQVRPPKRTKPAVQYRASTTSGGVVSTNGPSVLGDQSRFDWTEQNGGASGAPGRGFRASGSGEGQGDAVFGNGNGDGTGQTVGNDRWAAASDGSPGAAPGGSYMGPSKFYGGAGDGQHQATGQGAAPAGNGSIAASGAGGANGGQGFDGTGKTGNKAGGGTGGGTDSDGTGNGTAGSGAVADGNAGQAASGQAGSASAGATGSSMASSGQNAANGGPSGGQPMPGMAQSASATQGGPAALGASSDAASMAGRRGSNWASLASHDRPIPLTRPVRMECARDEFRILGDGGRVIKKVPIYGATEDAIDPLVREVHATVGSWGMAGDRMYWRPELVLSATPDGAARLADVEQLLADSGLDTRRSTAPRDVVRPLPPVYRTRARTGSDPQPTPY